MTIKLNEQGKQLQDLWESKYQTAVAEIEARNGDIIEEAGTGIIEPCLRDTIDYCGWMLISYDVGALDTIKEWICQTGNEYDTIKELTNRLNVAKNTVRLLLDDVHTKCDKKNLTQWATEVSYIQERIELLKVCEQLKIYFNN